MRTIGTLVVLAMVAASPALADPGNKHHGGGGGHWQDSERRGSDPQQHRTRDEGWQGQRGGTGDVLIGAAERSLIRQFYQEHPVRRGDYDLPPGIAKNVARGKPLPPGIAKKVPDGLYRRLPSRPGYDYRVVGADVMLVEIATGVIVDILRGGY